MHFQYNVWRHRFRQEALRNTNNDKLLVFYFQSTVSQQCTFNYCAYYMLLIILYTNSIYSSSGSLRLRTPGTLFQARLLSKGQPDGVLLFPDALVALGAFAYYHNLAGLRILYLHAHEIVICFSSVIVGVDAVDTCQVKHEGKTAEVFYS